jgi:dihydroorotate dehydrogenase electron transfer subunit
MTQHPKTRNTIYSEQAKIISHDKYAGEQFVLRLNAPLTSKYARPGSFIHMQCELNLLMRRPMSIMRANKNAGWIDILYKSYGLGTKQLTHREVGEIIDLLGPIGVPFKLSGYKKFPLLLGGGVGIPPMIFLAEHIKKLNINVKQFVIMGSEIPFPFKTRPSQIMVSGLPDGVIASMPLLDDWGIPSRLTSLQNYPGCFDGYITDLAKQWLTSLNDNLLRDVEIFSCGPTSMLEAVSQLAKEFELPCQISMEEFMACAVGGCAGCTIYLETEDGPAMKRVCVDGPVFDAHQVFPDTLKN